MSRRENKELAKTNLKNMDRTMQELQHIGSIKDLRPKNYKFCYQRQLVTERRRSSIFSYNSQMRVTPYQRNACVCILCLFEIITDRGIGIGKLYCKLLCGNYIQPIRGTKYVFHFLRKIIRTITSCY